MEVIGSRSLVSWLFHLLTGRIQPTFIGVIIHLLSTMDIPVVFCPAWICLVGDVGGFFYGLGSYVKSSPSFTTIWENMFVTFSFSHPRVANPSIWSSRSVCCLHWHLGGGFKYFLCSPLFGEDSHFD